jgi:heptosyltransferase-2
MRILIYRTGRLGDFIVAVPAMNLVRETYPNANILLLTCASTKQSFAKMTWTYASPNRPLPWLDFVIPHILNSAICFSGLRDLKELLRLRQQLSAAKIDRAYILPFTLESRKATIKKKIFLRLLGIRGPIFSGRSALPLHTVQHQIESTIAAVAEDPVIRPSCDSTIRFNLRVSDTSREWAHSVWQSRGFIGRKVIVVFVGGTYEHKRWPVQSFATLCGKLALDRSYTFIFVGSASERVWAEEAVCQLSAPCWNSCGETSLQQLAALLERSALFIGNDSGPGHLAAALGIPCVTFMTELYPAGIWEPRGSAAIALRHAVPCQFCRSETYCPLSTMACIRGITIEKAYHACQNLLNRDQTA